MPTRTELTIQVSELERKIKETELFLGQKTIALTGPDGAYSKMEEMRIEWALNDKNMKFMKSGEPPTINIKEYAGVKELLRLSRENYEEAATKARNLSVVCESYRRTIKEARAEIERIRAELDSYGTILQFPRKVS